MIQLDPIRLWGIPDFTVSEGKFIAGSATCVWCDYAAIIGEFVLVVQEEGRTDPFMMHLKCVPPEFKAAREFVIGLAQDQQNKTPQRA